MGFEPPHPNPLPNGERERTELAARTPPNEEKEHTEPEAEASCLPPRLPGDAQTAADHRARRRRAQTRMQCEQEFGRRPVGAMDGEAPAELVGLGADFRAMTRDARLVFMLPGLGAAGGNRARAFGLDELDA